MNIHITTTTQFTPPLLTQFTTLYENSFPYQERRPTQSLLQNIASGITQCHIAQSDNDNNLLGFITTQHLGDFYYCEYLAVQPHLRHQHIGTTILTQLLPTLRLPLILEVEPPTNQQAKARIAFYRRLGFHLSNRPYTQPSYHEIGLDALPLCLMEWGGTLLDQQYTIVVTTIHRHIYGK